MKLAIPELSLVLLVGPSGSGKSTFAARHFLPTEVVASDRFRAMICDDEANQGASRDAFEVLHEVVARRLRWRRFTVVDATNLQADARRPLLELARHYHYLTSAIVFDLDEATCQAHNLRRLERQVPTRVITTHRALLDRTREVLGQEGIHRVFVLRTLDDVARAVVRREAMRFDLRDAQGPFDIIGDVHGCIDELLDLLARLGYRVGYDTTGVIPCPVAVPPPGRTAIFLGDLGDRGPDTPGVYRLVIRMVRAGQALCVLGNHDFKLLRRLRGHDVRLTHGLAETLEQFARHPPELLDEVRHFLDECNNHYLLDDGRLVVAHAGLREDLQGRVSGRVQSFALYGDTTGEKDEFGLPVRRDWAAEYRGRALVAYGHTPVAEPAWAQQAVNVDTGCVFGGRLSALRYPEREIVSVPALRAYCAPSRPFLPGADGPRVAPVADSE
jgi:protein phosphatase